MNLTKTLIILLMLLLSTATIHAGEPTPESPQSLYLQAGKEERSGSTTKARELYESIIDRFPESEFAVKANDRLLSLPKTMQTPEAASTPSTTSPFGIFVAKPVKPLPPDPLLRRGVESARKKTKAEQARKNYIERERDRFTTSEGHRFNRAVLAEKEVQWQKAADQKIVDEFGMTLAEMEKELQQICKEAAIKGVCSEEALYLLATTP